MKIHGGYRSEEVIVPMQHRLPDHAVRTSSWTLYCTECSQEMTMMKKTAVEPGREMRTYACGCGHSERISYNVAVADGAWGSGYTSFQERKRAGP
jgi:hypothetical protein